MTPTNQDAISVVITTFQRPDACERALESVLAQSAQPLEVLICDDGSTDETPDRFRAWAERCPTVRYLRIAHNTGTPAAPRNLGIEHGRGNWVAFLDDDDEWLPEKLARQRAAMSTADADVIATNALRNDGGSYFPNSPAMDWPTRYELLKTNPIITSSAVVRRALAGFPTARWMRGIEDYAAWLTLADRQARFLILGDPLVRYDDVASERLSAPRVRRELAVARLAWRRTLRRPLDPGNAGAALRNTARAAYGATSNAWRRLARGA
jgi:glycosyltransferase involved in cell wall biosynthesis